MQSAFLITAGLCVVLLAMFFLWFVIRAYVSHQYLSALLSASRAEQWQTIVDLTRLSALRRRFGSADYALIPALVARRELGTNDMSVAMARVTDMPTLYKHYIARERWDGSALSEYLINQYTNDTKLLDPKKVIFMAVIWSTVFALGIMLTMAGMASRRRAALPLDLNGGNVEIR
jgi:hypothetical protein